MSLTMKELNALQKDIAEERYKLMKPVYAFDKALCDASIARLNRMIKESARGRVHPAFRSVIAEFDEAMWRMLNPFVKLHAAHKFIDGFRELA